MAEFFKRIKTIPTETQFTVFGYIRQNENKLSLFCNITDIISYLCLSYYYIAEYFEKVGDDMKISQDGMTITKIINNNNWNNTSYCHKWIDSNIDQIVEWRFKINELDCGFGICLCLVSRDDKLNEKCIFDAPCYTLYDDADHDIQDINAIIGNSNDIDQLDFDKHDEISVILNTKHREIHLQKNKNEKILFVKNISINHGIKYKMAVTMYEQFNSVSLISFESTKT